MQLTFGNMTLELNIFHLSNKHKLVENGNQGTDEVCSVNPTAEKPNASKLQRLAKKNEAIDWELSASATTSLILFCFFFIILRFLLKIIIIFYVCF